MHVARRPAPPPSPGPRRKSGTENRGQTCLPGLSPIFFTLASLPRSSAVCGTRHSLKRLGLGQSSPGLLRPRPGSARPDGVPLRRRRATRREPGRRSAMCKVSLYTLPRFRQHLPWPPSGARLSPFSTESSFAPAGDRVSAMRPGQPDNCGLCRKHNSRLRMYADRAFLESVGQRDNVYAAVSAGYI
jgi:hypothetical protein